MAAKMGRAATRLVTTLSIFSEGGELAHVLALEAALQHAGDVVVAFVDDDGLGVVVQEPFGLPDVLLDVGEDGGVKVQLGEYLFVPLKDLDGVPPLAVGGHSVYGGLLDVGQGVLHLSREDVMGDVTAVLGGLNGQLHGLGYTCSLEGRDLDGGTAHTVGQGLQIDQVTLLAEHIYHVDGHDHGDT